jgi:phage terminase large subunit
MNLLHHPREWNIAKNLIFETFGYHPTVAQQQVHNSLARFRVLVSGRRGGKSFLSAKELEAVACTRALGAKRCWVVAPTYDLSDKIFREIFADCVTGRVCKSTGKYIPPIMRRSDIKKVSESERTIKFAWGSEIIGKSAEKPVSLVGDSVDCMVIDEAAKIKSMLIWEKYLKPCLSDTQGSAIFPTTPEGNNWIKPLYLRGQDPNHPDWESFSFPTIANTALPKLKEEVAAARREMTEETFLQEYEAAFISRHGRVFKLFDVSTHVFSEVPKFDVVIAGLDWGFTNPTALIIIGIKDGRYYVVDEVYERELSNAQIIAHIRRLQKKWGFRHVYPDSAEPDRIKALTNSGINVKKVNKAVAAGIEKVAGKMKIRKDGKPDFSVHAECVNTIGELESYAYPEKKDSQNTKEEPIKHNDHACDALRYAIFSYETKSTGIKFGRGLY